MTRASPLHVRKQGPKTKRGADTHGIRVTLVRSKIVASLGSTLHGTLCGTRVAQGRRGNGKAERFPKGLSQRIGFADALPYSLGQALPAADLRWTQKIWSLPKFFCLYSKDTRVTQTRLNPAGPSSVRRNRTLPTYT